MEIFNLGMAHKSRFYKDLDDEGRKGFQYSDISKKYVHYYVLQGVEIKEEVVDDLVVLKFPKRSGKGVNCEKYSKSILKVLHRDASYDI